MLLDIYKSVVLSKKLRLEDEASSYSNARICLWKIDVAEDYLVKLRSNLDSIQDMNSVEESKLQTQATGQPQIENIGQDDSLDTELGKGI